MPTKASRPCKHRNCPNLVASGESYCAEHKEIHLNDYARAHPEYFRLYNNKRWRRYRRMYLAEHPLCINYRQCRREATVVDHIKDHKGDWDTFWNPDNHQPMCKACHDTKTGSTRGWGNDRASSAQ